MPDKIKALRATGEGNLYVQTSGDKKILVTEFDSMFAGLVKTAFFNGSKVEIEHDATPSTSSPEYYKITGIYVGEWA